MSHPNASRIPSRGGFTLIELLVVMAIIATLAGLAMMVVPRALRNRDKTACLNNLRQIFAQLMEYQERYKGLPASNGRAFVFAIWDAKLIDHNKKDAEVFFCPSLQGVPPVGIDQLEAEHIDYTGPDLTGYGKRLRIQDRNANEKVIVCDRCITVVEDKDKDRLPHSAEGICYLTLGGAAEFMAASEFGDYVTIGPNSQVDKFKWMAPDEQ